MGDKKQEHFGNRTILLVEDDADVRRVMSLALSRYGYTILEADSAESAIQIWEQHSQDICLLLTDIRMPGKTGVELARILRQKQPKISVLLMSGYSPELSNKKEKIANPMLFLEKPFSIQILFRTVYTAIHSCCLHQMDQQPAA